MLFALRGRPVTSLTPVEPVYGTVIQAARLVWRLQGLRFTVTGVENLPVTGGAVPLIALTRLARKRPPAAVITTIKVIRGFARATMSRSAMVPLVVAVASSSARGSCMGVARL